MLNYFLDNKSWILFLILVWVDSKNVKMFIHIGNESLV